MIALPAGCPLGGSRRCAARRTDVLKAIGHRDPDNNSGRAAAQCQRRCVRRQQAQEPEDAACIIAFLASGEAGQLRGAWLPAFGST